ncbi:Phosphoadenosine phosphosulfate reductase [Candidatus Filomicrobium marinum]|uniref:Adenosine 5'-phosphosulfate reductase n=1 Tax=Candidatus Filomicrobium marinum TaxID=1608628 RepID=A0A0D6JBW3_9HYPH|nr:phosphoadenylyl-sulfate reductase [Candidatus Filomicrobium marinum]CFX08221.1 Phosphoadenosine phosphosulfate reductase [Candidatus Filomicrobium marinum]CPR16752.1 Phosphoadenosine phosphosulfate reductase [Candidatus Filomicrobium marinum]
MVQVKLERRAPESVSVAKLDADIGKLETLEARIAFIGRAIEGRISFSTSLGLEDQAVLHAIAHEQRVFDVFMLDTGRHFPETLETLDTSQLRYGQMIRMVSPDAGETQELIARDGVFGFRTSIDARKACCVVRKVRPLAATLAGATAWVTGLRRSQSQGRNEVSFASWDGAMNLIKINPIADWSLDRLEAYISDNSIPVNTLHARGFPSIGCQPCTRAIKPGEDIRAGRWWWENEDGKECGLHSRPARLPSQEKPAPTTC